MFQHQCRPPRMVWFSVLAALFAGTAAARAQNFSMQVADPNPLGIGSFVPGLDQWDVGLEGHMKGAFIYGLEAETVYNSNFFLTDGHEDDEISEFIHPWIRYISDPEGGATASLIVNYNPVVRFYAENSDLNDTDQSGDFVLTLQGSRTQISFFGRYDQVSGTDRLTGDFVQGSLFTGGVRGTRQIAPRTSINGGLSFAHSDYGSGSDQGADIFTANLGGVWQATPRFGWGPNLRYTRTESDNSGTRNAIALMVDARYQLGERIWFDASVGPEYAQNSDRPGGGSDNSLGLTGDITARYNIDERWTWLASFRAATVPSPSENNYLVNDFMLSTSLQRQLLRGVVVGGMEYHLSNYQDVGTVTAARGDENNVALFLDYRRPLFNERAFFESMLRYSVNDGDKDWEQWLLSLGLNVSF